MSDIDLQNVLGSRYRTSQEADRYTLELQKNLGLSTKAQVARIAIGRSLSMGPMAKDTAGDSKGLDIPATSLFSTDDIGSWVGLLVTHAITADGNQIQNGDELRNAIRNHWHRGIMALWSDWKAAGDNYDKFVETLISRRSEMPEFATQTNSDTNPPDESEENVAQEQDKSQLLVKALGELDIKVEVKDSIVGPRITRYRVLLTNLADSPKIKRSVSQLGLALNLGNAVPTVSNGDEPKTLFIDVPRAKATWKPVLIERLKNWAHSGGQEINDLLVYAGVTVTGEDVVFNIASQPHLLVGGTTGSGKSVCLHSLLLSLLIRHKSSSLKVALIDPKQVEFAPYAKIPHLYGGAVATEIPQAKEYLTELVAEMEQRYAMFNKLGVVNIVEARQRGQTLPYIVVFIEELADLVLQDDDIEPLLARLAQKARAAGIHLVLATQRPDSRTFSGLIRSNIPARIALTVQKGTESNIILDEKGAEDLLGSGDMLIRLSGESPKRAHGVFVKIEHIVDIVRSVQ